MAFASDPIRVSGLRELQASLKRMDGQSQKRLRLALNDVAELVVAAAQPRVPRRTGRAAASLRPSSSQREASVRGGGGRAEYFPWLDFGGRVGRGKSVSRPFLRDGRYLYAAYRDRRSTIREAIAKGLENLIRDAGLDPS